MSNRALVLVALLTAPVMFVPGAVENRGRRRAGLTTSGSYNVYAHEGKYFVKPRGAPLENNRMKRISEEQYRICRRHEIAALILGILLVPPWMVLVAAALMTRTAEGRRFLDSIRRAARRGATDGSSGPVGGNATADS